MKPHLLLALEAPLMVFGAVTVDAFGKVDDFPAKAMLVGLLGNALGYDRSEGARLDRLQARIVCGAAILREGQRLTDAQNAKLDRAEKAWTTRGRPEGRAGGQETYDSPHRRFRDYTADGCVLIAVRLEPADSEPTIDEIAVALREPERPLFIGRKPCLPARPVLHGRVEASTIVDALSKCLAEPADQVSVGSSRVHLPVPAFPVRARRPANEEERQHDRVMQICEERDWVAGVHVGLSRVREGRLSLAARA
jgi:CRISPR system Cascade subunit CasD